ncbi:MAG TPA: hypothetical protein VFR86_13750 [Burkholderiaceae bacterium]|nr:hypothetical protein [Burkholderiaceae bacterium]
MNHQVTSLPSPSGRGVGGEGEPPGARFVRAPAHRARQLWKILALTVLTCASGAQAQTSQQVPAAVAPELVRIKLADLEHAFWFCDYTATTERAAAANITTCAAVYDALKQRKFNGDIDKLFAWWQQNKAQQHHRLQRSAGER